MSENVKIIPIDKTDERQLRIDLAAALGLAARNDWHAGVANHFSAAASPDGRKFLVNPRWKHFSMAKASELLLVDADDPDTMKRPDAPDPSAWSIHSAIHRRLPHARVALHLHPPYATTLATLRDPTIHPIDQVTARFFRRIAYDMNFGGIATQEAEGERIAGPLGDFDLHGRRYLAFAKHLFERLDRALGALLFGERFDRAREATGRESEQRGLAADLLQVEEDRELATHG